MNGFCLWKRSKGKVGFYRTECGEVYLGNLTNGKFMFCPYCKGYVISEYRCKGKAYTEGERK